MINFNFGKKKPDKKQLLIVGVVLSSIIATLSQCTGVSENGLWDLLDEIQRKYFPGTIVNELILQDPHQVKRRVERDVDRALIEYERLTGDTGEVRIPSPRLVEKPSDGSKSQELLGGEMRLCAPWVDDCPKE
jgi:hypothetical protein